MSLDSTPAEGAISIEQAVGLLSAEPAAEAPAAAVEPDAEAADAEIEQNDASTPEVDTEVGPDEGGEDGDAEEIEAADEQPKVEAPAWWPAERKELFAKADPALQQAIVEAEAGRESHLGKLREETVTAKKAADTEAETYRSTLQAVAEWLPGAVATFKSRWADITAEDWTAFAAKDPAGYTQAKAQHDLEAEQIAKAQKAHNDAQEVQRASAFKAEVELLPKHAPALVDPEKGSQNKAALAKYLVDSGVDAAILPDLTAVALGLAWKAHLYDQGVAKLAAPKPKTITPPQKGNVAPSAAPSRTSQQRSIDQFEARLNKDPSIDNAVALLQARRK